MDEKLRIFGKRLKELRDERTLSQAEVAEAVETTKSMISYYENGKKEPGFLTILKLSNFFGVSASYLMGEIDNR